MLYLGPLHLQKGFRFILAWAENSALLIGDDGHFRPMHLKGREIILGNSVISATNFYSIISCQLWIKLLLNFISWPRVRQNLLESWALWIPIALEWWHSRPSLTSCPGKRQILIQLTKLWPLSRSWLEIKWVQVEWKECWLVAKFKFDFRLLKYKYKRKIAVASILQWTNNVVFIELPEHLELSFNSPIFYFCLKQWKK